MAKFVDMCITCITRLYNRGISSLRNFLEFAFLLVKTKLNEMERHKIMETEKKKKKKKEGIFR